MYEGCPKRSRPDVEISPEVSNGYSFPELWSVIGLQFLSRDHFLQIVEQEKVNGAKPGEYGACYSNSYSFLTTIEQVWAGTIEEVCTVRIEKHFSLCQLQMLTLIASFSSSRNSA